MERATKKSSQPSLNDLKGQLQIDTDDLDGSLVEQPDLYYHVAEQFALAVANRDTSKLELEEAQAELDEQYRKKALEDDVKITEAALSKKLIATPRIQELERALLATRAEADKWQALKEAFQQRSFMLRELVSIRISNLNNLSLERGVNRSHADLADANHSAAGRLRQERKGNAR